MRRLAIICLLSLTVIALLGLRYITEPTYRLNVNFEGVSTTPDWPLPTRLLYTLIPEDYANQRFGLALSAGNEGCMNRTPTVPAGPCEIHFSEITTTRDGRNIWMDGKLRLELPRSENGTVLRVDVKECPGVVGVAASEKDRLPSDEKSPPWESSAATGTFYTDDVSKVLEIPFNRGHTTIYLIYKHRECREYLPFGICRLP